MASPSKTKNASVSPPIASPAHATLPSQLNPVQQREIDLILSPITLDWQIAESRNGCDTGSAGQMRSVGATDSNFPPANVFCEAVTERSFRDGNGNEIFSNLIKAIKGDSKDTPVAKLADDIEVPVADGERLSKVIAVKAALAEPGEEMKLRFTNSAVLKLTPGIILDASTVAGFNGSVKQTMNLSEQEVQDIAQKVYNPNSTLPTPTPNQIEGAGVQLGQQIRLRMQKVAGR